MGKQNDIIVVLLYELRNHVQLLLRLNLSMKNLLHNNRSRRSWPKTATFSLATNRNLPSRARSDNVPIQGYVTPKTPPWRSQAGLVYCMLVMWSVERLSQCRIGFGNKR